MLLEPEEFKPVEAGQAKMNRSTRGQWDWYAHHRRMIERLIIPESREQRICILGAGNCNDLDLKWMAQAYAEARLVDLDDAALKRAVERQGVEAEMGDGEMERGVVLQAPVDLTAIADLVGSWKGRAVSSEVVQQAISAVEGDDAEAELSSGSRSGLVLLGMGHSGDARSSAASAGVARRADSFTRPLLGRFDVVLSPCVLSQLWCGVRDVLGATHPQWQAIKAAIRRRHLRQMIELLRPGSRGVLICDLASSRKVKGLERAREEELESLLRLCIAEGKGFRGLEPVEIAAAVRASGGGAMETSRPWLWHLGAAKAFLCYGAVFRKA